MIYIFAISFSYSYCLLCCVLCETRNKGKGQADYKHTPQAEAAGIAAGGCTHTARVTV